MVVLSVIIVVVLLVLVVASHEAGHAIAAIILGIPIKSVSIGIPLPPKFNLTFWGKTLKFKPWLQKKYEVKGISFNAQPWLFGGLVYVKDEELFKHGHWKTVLFTVAGPLTNIVLGLIPAVLAFGPSVGVQVAGELASATVQSLQMLATGQVGFDLLVGPIGLIAITSNAVRIEPFLGTLFVWLLFSLTIGVINLAPIPALDGGVILFGPLQRTRSPLVNRTAKIVNVVFLFLLLGGMIALTIKDIVTLL